ncbi:pathogenesis-related protein 1A-like [Ricinus communis]|uniref:pathogenesis-related protein 1A-like n=1 Tax=Ricinus communis TaxID=3988 RepID=UPI00201A2E83|nr:pathogenesis-related protein 1A-like [Ricinus communis]
MAITLAPFSLAKGAAKAYLAAHNTVRAEVGVEPLVWNKTLAAYAQNYSNSKIKNFVFEHSNYLQYGYGECLAASGDQNFSGSDAVKLWADEKQYYDYKSNTCQEGQVCGHYTQLSGATHVK